MMGCGWQRILLLVLLALLARLWLGPYSPMDSMSGALTIFRPESSETWSKSWIESIFPRLIY